MESSKATSGRRLALASPPSMISTWTRKVSISCVPAQMAYPASDTGLQIQNAMGIEDYPARGLSCSFGRSASTCLSSLPAVETTSFCLATEPARIAAVNPENLTATVGQPLADSLVAEVTDRAGPAGAGRRGDLCTTRRGLDPADTDWSPRCLGPGGGSLRLEHHGGRAGGGGRAPPAIVPDTNGLTSFHVAAQPGKPESLAMAGGWSNRPGEGPRRRNPWP